MGGLCIVSVRLIIYTINLSERDTFEEIAVLAFGRKFGLLIEFAIIFFCFGTCVAYLISVGDIGTDIVKVFFAEDTTVWWQQLLVGGMFLCVFRSKSEGGTSGGFVRKMLLQEASS